MTAGQNNVGPAPHGRPWYGADVVLIGLLFAYVTFIHSRHLRWYVGGLHNRAPIFLDPFILLLMLATPVAAGCLLVLIERIALAWPRHIPDRKRLGRLRALVVFGLLAFAGLFFLPLPRSYDPFILGYRKYVRSHVNVPVMRMWLDTLDPNGWAGETVDLAYLTEAERAGWPQAIVSSKPHKIEFFPDAEGHLAVSLMWSSLDDAWGVEIGDTDMKIAKPVPREEAATTAREHAQYRLLLEPGAYVWHDVH